MSAHILIYSHDSQPVATCLSTILLMMFLLQAEEERKRKEEQERREHEEYLKLKEAFTVDEEGQQDMEADLDVSR